MASWQVWDAYDGQLSATPATTLFTVSVPGIIGEILVSNTDSSARTCNFYINRSGTDIRIFGKDISVDAGGYRRLRCSIAVQNGDILKGDASVGAKLDTTVSGVKFA